MISNRTRKIKPRNRARPTETRSNFMRVAHMIAFKTNTRAADDCGLYNQSERGWRQWEFDKLLTLSAVLVLLIL